MKTRPSWDIFYLNMCDSIAEMSKDNLTQLGSVIVDSNNSQVSQGFNSFPRNIDDDNPSRQQRPHKYKYFEHAERNSIYNSCRLGLSLMNCKIYVPWVPCADCARAIIQVGITEVIVRKLDIEDRWLDSMIASIEMFNEAKIIVRLPDKLPEPLKPWLLNLYTRNTELKRSK